MKANAKAAKEPPAAPAANHTARARVLEVKLKGSEPVILGEAGNLNVRIRANHASAGDVTVPRVLTGRQAHAAIIGQGNYSFAEASLAELDLTIGNHRITASYLASRASANDRGGRASVSGRAEIVGLVVDGRPVPTPIRPNHRIWWPDGHLSLNEVQAAVPGHAGHVTVTALRAVLKDQGEVVIGEVEAGINVNLARPCGLDFISGSGWLTTAPSRTPIRLSLTYLRNKDGTLSHHLQVDDPTARIRLAGTSVTTFGNSSNRSNVRQIQGEATLNGTPGMRYRLELTDGGDNTGDDRVLLILTNGYVAAGLLQGGNIRLVPCR